MITRHGRKRTKTYERREDAKNWLDAEMRKIDLGFAGAHPEAEIREFKELYSAIITVRSKRGVTSCDVLCPTIIPRNPRRMLAPH